MSLTEGDNAPDFTLPASFGRTVSLKGQNGKPFVLYFYPKADTPGCTKEACAFEESLPEFKDIAVIGVSPDAIAPIETFATKFNLTFPLAADPDNAVATAYGVWVEKSMYGKKYMGVDRTTYILDESGMIEKIFEKVKPIGHGQEVRDYLAS